jgi:hypothetical protein
MISKTDYSELLLKALKDLPRTIGESKQTAAAKEGDPLPFSVITKGNRTTFYIPKELPENDEKLVKFVALFVSIAESVVDKIEITKREVKPAFWGTCKALQDSLEGAFYCLKRETILPQDNIPANLKTGWDFALWYAYSGASGDTDGGNYLRINRLTSLSSVSDTAWGSKESLADLVRITNSIRTISTKYGGKLGECKKFLKGKGYFQQMACGKKPSAGLYQPEELDLVVRNWETKFTSVNEAYDAIPLTFAAVGPGDKTATIVSRFNIANPANIKKIEETRLARIPELLVDAPKVRGKKQEKTISKGNDLSEKLISISGGNIVRTIGKVFWTPLQECSKNVFVDLCIEETRSLLSGRGSRIHRRLTELEGIVTPSDVQRELASTLRSCMTYVSAAANVYLEVIPDRRGNSAWDAAFPAS